MKIALIDLKESPQGCNNKDKAGTFGNAAHGEGLVSRLYAILKHRQVGTPVVHLGYLAAIFRQAWNQVAFYDAEPNDEDVVIIESSIVGYDEELAFAKKIKRPGRKVGFIGAFSTVKSDLFLEHSDFVITGEPEAAAIALAKGERPFEGVIDSPLIDDLDRLPFPDWDGFPVKKYSYYPIQKKTPIIPMLTSRGCPFGCSYCPYMVTQKNKWRARSAKNAVDEMESLVEKYGIRSIVIRDPVYTQSRQRTIEISNEILRRSLKVDWSCESRSDCLDEEQLRLMHRSGLRAIHLGIESPTEDIVRRSGRSVIQEMQQEKIVRLCEKIGINVAAFYILGYLDDTVQSMTRTIEYAKHLNTPFAQFDVMTPYLGTRFFEEIKDRIVDFDWKKYTTHHPVVKLNSLTAAEVLEFKNRAYREYYLRPAWIFKHGIRIFGQ